MKVNEIYETNGYGKLKVIDYINARNVVIEFVDTGFVKTVEAGNIRRGSVKDQLRPSVEGVGFIGIGKHKESDKAYNHWTKMLKRGYDKKLKKRLPSYVDCTVCKEWHNFQNFAEWFRDNYSKELKRPSIDKDILVKGNKLYSPETCLIVEMSENIAEKNRTNEDPIEVVCPNGITRSVTWQKEFCEKYGLLRSGLNRLLKGKRKSYKGWHLKTKEE